MTLIFNYLYCLVSITHMNHRHQAAITSNLFDYNLLLNLRITKAKICFTLSFIIATIKACSNGFIVTPPPGWLYLVITYVLGKKIFLHQK